MAEVKTGGLQLLLQQAMGNAVLRPPVTDGSGEMVIREGKEERVVADKTLGQDVVTPT